MGAIGNNKVYRSRQPTCKTGANGGGVSSVARKDLWYMN